MEWRRHQWTHQSKPWGLQSHNANDYQWKYTSLRKKEHYPQRKVTNRGPNSFWVLNSVVLLWHCTPRWPEHLVNLRRLSSFVAEVGANPKKVRKTSPFTKAQWKELCRQKEVTLKEWIQDNELVLHCFTSMIFHETFAKIKVKHVSSVSHDGGSCLQITNSGGELREPLTNLVKSGVDHWQAWCLCLVIQPSKAVWPSPTPNLTKNPSTFSEGPMLIYPFPPHTLCQARIIAPNCN